MVSFTCVSYQILSSCTIRYIQNIVLLEIQSLSQERGMPRNDSPSERAHHQRPLPHWIQGSVLSQRCMDLQCDVRIDQPARTEGGLTNLHGLPTCSETPECPVLCGLQSDSQVQKSALRKPLSYMKVHRLATLMAGLTEINSPNRSMGQQMHC